MLVDVTYSPQSLIMLEIILTKSYKHINILYQSRGIKKHNVCDINTRPTPMVNIGEQSVQTKVLNELRHEAVALRHRQYVKVLLLMKREHTLNQP